MLSLTYVSSSAGLISAEQLGAMLAAIRPKNEALGITGMLLYSDGNIIQTLEGPEDAVEETFRSIEEDPRHRGIIVVLREPVTERAFPDWSMGFRQLAGSDLGALPGYSSFLSQPLAADLGAAAAPAYRLLEVFRDTVR